MQHLQNPKEDSEAEMESQPSPKPHPKPAPAKAQAAPEEVHVPMSSAPVVFDYDCIKHTARNKSLCKKYRKITDDGASLKNPEFWDHVTGELDETKLPPVELLKMARRRMVKDPSMKSTKKLLRSLDEKKCESMLKSVPKAKLAADVEDKMIDTLLAYVPKNCEAAKKYTREMHTEAKLKKLKKHKKSEPDDKTSKIVAAVLKALDAKSK